jgi:hypothetical protein
VTSWLRVFRPDQFGRPYGETHAIATLLAVQVALIATGRCPSPSAAAEAVATTESARLVCSAEKPVVVQGETIRLRAWAPATRPDLSWEAAVGDLRGDGIDAQWTLTDAPPVGPYRATIRVRGTADPANECSLEVFVLKKGSEDSTLRGEAAWGFLPARVMEVRGYGLYSYLLLGSPPSTGAAREQYLAVIDAYLTTIPHIVPLEVYLKRKQLNIAYLPVRVVPPVREKISPVWVLERYDYDRAQRVLGVIGGDRREGPYIVSSLQPLPSQAPLSGVGFYDLTGLRPHLAALYVKEFLRQSAQERLWEPRTAQRVGRQLRLTIPVLGDEESAALEGVNRWITLPQ